MRGLAYLAVPLAFAAAFLLLPLTLLVAVSLTTGYPLDPVPSWDSYRQLVADAFYRSYVITTILFGLAVTASSVLAGYPLAYFLVRHAKRSYNWLLVAIVSPLLVSVVARTVGWTIILGNDGPLNRGLLALGLADAPVQILFTPVAATIGMVHVLLPFMVLSLASVLTGLDGALEEVALSLGAGSRQVFWRVTFPLSLPGVGAGSMLVFLLAIGSYVTPVLLGGGKVRLLAPMIYNQITSVVDWSLGSAMAVMLLLTGVIVLAAAPLLGRR